MTPQLEPRLRGQLGQFMSPWPVAEFMASLFTGTADHVRLLDPGSGLGTLTASFVDQALNWPSPPKSIYVVSYEVDSLLAAGLRETLADCSSLAERHGVRFSAEVKEQDFIQAAASSLQTPGPKDPAAFNYAILNPPYKKIGVNSMTRRYARAAGLEVVNLYAAFTGLAVKLLSEQGQLVAITPRSFCNGTYFKPFRRFLLKTASIRHLHVYESRDQAFRNDKVLQENLIFKLTKGRPQDDDSVLLTSTKGPDSSHSTTKRVPLRDIVDLSDPQLYIHLGPSTNGSSLVHEARKFKTSLADLGIEVSTGRVVEFRARQFLKDAPDFGSAALIHPANFDEGLISWPKLGIRRPAAISACSDTKDLLVPNGTYVLVRRFSAKEERRRVAAALYDPIRVARSLVGFENHLNYLHEGGRGLTNPLVARGLVIFLNSSLVDECFRQFSGHTQVNAGDLRRLKCPSAEELEELGTLLDETLPEQEAIDQAISDLLARREGLAPARLYTGGLK